MTAIAELVSAKIQILSLDDLEASAKNPRRTMNDGELMELAASIREHGVQVPLLVRPDPAFADNDNESRYEIICGHRRSEAATLAGLTSVPCIVRDLSDEQAAEIALIDNLQRVDVPPMEEAEAFDELLDRLQSIPAVAAKVGKEQSYVAKRLKLRTLTTNAQDALRERIITIDHALLLARLGADEQDAALKWCLDRNAGSKTPVEKVVAQSIERVKSRAEGRSNWLWEPQSPAQLKEHIEKGSGTPLARAPWPMEEDWLLPDVGSCLDCPQNTKANAPLFGDLDIGVPTCTDGGCFKAKTVAFVQIQQQAAAKTLAAELGRKSSGDVQILRVSWKSTSTVPRQLKDGGGVNPDQVFKDGQWVEAKKTCPSSVLTKAVTVDWSDTNHRGYMGDEKKLRKPGEILSVCVEPKCKVHPKAYDAAPRSHSGNRNENSPERRAERERMEAAIKAENEIRAGLVKTAVAGVERLSDELLRSVVLLALSSWGIDEGVRKLFPGFEKNLKTSAPDSPAFAKAASALFFVDEERNYFLPDWSDDVSAGRKDLLKLLQMMGWRGADPWAKPAPAKKTPKAAGKKPAKKAAKKAGKR